MTYRDERNSDYREESFSVSRAGNRLIDAARRNPEALVILAAGAALLLRRGTLSGGRGRAARDFNGERGEERGMIGEAGEYVSEAAERVADTAGAYAATLSDYAEDGRRLLTREVSQLRRGASRIVRRTRASAERMLDGQPAAVAAFGLATGAVAAALLPRSEAEQRALEPARQALAGAANRAVETVKETAERRLSAEGLTDLAADAAKIVTKTVLGGSARGDDDRA